MSKLQPTKAAGSMEAARNPWSRQRVYICNLIVWLSEKTRKKSLRRKYFYSEKEPQRKQHQSYCQQTTATTLNKKQKLTEQNKTTLIANNHHLKNLLRTTNIAKNQRPSTITIAAEQNSTTKI
jgi:hypothetical protein